MVPDLTRRRLLSGVSLACLTSVAGCISSVGAGEDDPETTTTTTTEQPPTETTTSEGEVVGSPAETVRSYIETRSENPLDARQYFHPAHPFRTDRVDAETAEQLLALDGEITDVTLEARQQDVTPEAVLSTPLLGAADVERATVADALDGAQPTLVEGVVRTADGSRQTYRILTVTADREWVILAQGVEPTGGPTGPFGGRVVTDVSFDTEADRARVYFDPSLTADRLTARASERYSERSSTTPGDISYFDVRLDSSGDELVVTATVDGTTRPIHREQYPPSDRLVGDVTFVGEPERDDAGAVSRVAIGQAPDETVTVRSTVEGDTASGAPVSAGADLVVDVDPGGDEVVVTAGGDGQSEVLRRERHVF